MAFDDVNAECPFFKSSKSASINCEGVDSESSLTLSFHTSTGQWLQKNKRAYTGHYCNHNYKDCIIYKMLMAKYE